MPATKLFLARQLSWKRDKTQRTKAASSKKQGWIDYSNKIWIPH